MFFNKVMKWIHAGCTRSVGRHIGTTSAKIFENHDKENSYLYDAAVDGFFPCVRYFVEAKYVPDEMSS